MPDGFFSHIDPVTFLQTFVSESVKINKELGCAGCDTATVNYIEQLGLNASSSFEEAYRRDRKLEGPMRPHDYADLIVQLKNRIGGKFSRASGEKGTVRVVNKRCPFGQQVSHAPDLCKMTSSVFGGIAARNFGYAKVSLIKRLAAGDDICEVSIALDHTAAADWEGDEYRLVNNMVVGRAASAELSSRIENNIHRAWCNGKTTKEKSARRPVIVADSRAMREALETVEIVAPTDATVLITGETGVGKEIIARAVHATSQRWKKRFVPVNCGSIPENLVESALFGHERGAFTGAYEVHHGFFERAEGGTLFLDEVDSLPLPAQARLLRVLQEGEYERVGGKHPMESDVRIVAAGSRRLEDLVADGQFRSDLYYRLNVVPIHIPPLRERPEDLRPLVHHILSRLSERYGKPAPDLTVTALNRLQAYHWPGNVRELENILERSFLMCSARVLSKIILPRASGCGDTAASTQSNCAGKPMSLKDARKQAADQVEVRVLRNLLKGCSGNITEVARQLDISPRAVHLKLNSHRIDPSAYRGTADDTLAGADGLANQFDGPPGQPTVNGH